MRQRNTNSRLGSLPQPPTLAPRVVLGLLFSTKESAQLVKSLRQAHRRFSAHVSGLGDKVASLCQDTDSRMYVLWPNRNVQEMARAALEGAAQVVADQSWGVTVLEFRDKPKTKTRHLATKVVLRAARARISTTFGAT